MNGGCVGDTYWKWTNVVCAFFVTFAGCCLHLLLSGISDNVLSGQLPILDTAFGHVRMLLSHLEK